MKTTAALLAPLAVLALAACGETGESADIDMSADAVAPGAGDGTAEGPAGNATLTPGEMVSPAPEPFAPMDEQPTATPAPMPPATAAATPQ